MKKILTVIGARPQFVKAAAVSREISKCGQLKEIIVHTGQHFDKNMSEIFFSEMKIPEPDYNLNIHSLNHGAMTGQMLEKIEKIILQDKPDAVLVYGDTNSTLSGALCARKLHLKLAHVEAGLRSYNMLMPEEINRILTDRISDLLFCPTDQAVKNLNNEGFENFNAKIIISGDVMYDSVLFYSQISAQSSKIMSWLKPEKFALCTVHRAENTDDINNLISIIDALNEINENIRVVLPIHPRTRKFIEKHDIKAAFTMIDPVGYFDMLELLKHCSLVLTDSGGLQKEAFFFGKHCVTLREETEWIELVDNGYNMLAGSSRSRILECTSEMLAKTSDFNKKLYGGGNAAEIIVNEMREMLGVHS